MKTFLFFSFFFFLVFPINLTAQNKNAVRIGVGVNIRNSWPSEKNLVVGPSLFVEYGREINSYISLGANIHCDMNKYGEFNNLNAFGVSLRTIVTLLPKKFRWIKIGIGATYENRRDIYGENIICGNEKEIVAYNQATIHLWGFDFPIRAYLIDNKRFEFYAFYELKTMFMKGEYCWNYSNGGGHLA